MAETLRSLGVNAERSGRNDILVEGRKCSGYAKRLSRDRMMIHGTLMWDVNLETLTRALAVPGSKLQAAGIASVRSRVANLKDFLPGLPDIQAFRNALHEQLADGDGEICLSPAQLEEIEQDAETKFRTWEWNYGRSPRADFSSRRKFGCGTVEASWSIVHGCIADLHFAGDFLGNLSPDGLIERLNGCRYDRTKLLERLSQTDPSLYFDRLSSDDLLSLFF
jgi:lipoate-protein ligase A